MERSSDSMSWQGPGAIESNGRRAASKAFPGSGRRGGAVGVRVGDPDSIPSRANSERNPIARLPACRPGRPLIQPDHPASPKLCDRACCQALWLPGTPKHPCGWRQCRAPTKHECQPLLFSNSTVTNRWVSVTTLTAHTRLIPEKLSFLLLRYSMTTQQRGDDWHSITHFSDVLQLTGNSSQDYMKSDRGWEDGNGGADAPYHTGYRSDRTHIRW